MSDSKTSTGSQPARTRALLDPDDSVLLLLDHQAGLFQTVKDISIAELRANTIMLARLSALLNIPLITSASVPDGPNGPLMPEIALRAECDVRPEEGRNQCVGQRRPRQDGSRHRSRHVDHRRRVDERLRGVPSA